MKIGIEMAQNSPKFYLRYEGDEWKKVKDTLEQMGLEKHRTSNLLGTGQSGDFYKEKNGELLSAVTRTVNSGMPPTRFAYTDNINSPLITDMYINIAIFRIVPSDGNVIKVSLPKFLSILEVDSMAKVICKVYGSILNIFTGEISIREEEES